MRGLKIDGCSLTVDSIERFLARQDPVTIDHCALRAVRAAHRFVAKIVQPRPPLEETD